MTRRSTWIEDEQKKQARVIEQDFAEVLVTGEGV